MVSSSTSSAVPDGSDKEQGEREQDGDLERQDTRATTSPKKMSKLRMVYDQSAITVSISHHKYKGSGTEEDPYIVEWIPEDPRNPMIWPDWYKWFVALTNAFSTLCISFSSSAYTGGLEQIMKEFHVGSEVATLGLSLFVLGFAIGPLFWGPLSELYGRQILYIGTYMAFLAFNAGAAGAQNIQTLIILRFWAGAFGSSPLTNAGGVIADMFTADKRGQAFTLFACAPFMGPVLGPIVGSFVGQTVGWRWVEGVMAIFTGVMWIFQTLLVPETYGPVLLRRRADRLSQKTGKHYVSILDKSRGRPKLSTNLKVALSRPWVLLFVEPIVLFITIYMAIVYGTLYMEFGAFPIVFEEHRHWSQGISALAFIPLAIGIALGGVYTLYDGPRYRRAVAKSGSEAPPEARLPPAILGSIILPIGLFWFAWTCQSSVHWIVPMIGAGIFGCAIMLIFLPLMNYLVDSYTIYAASVLAGNSILRSAFGAAFPLFTTYMYKSLGVNWASSIPAFLSVACIPFPFLFWKYGATIRMKCKYSAQAHEAMEAIRRSQRQSTAIEQQEEEEEAEQEAEFSPDPPSILSRRQTMVEENASPEIEKKEPSHEGDESANTSEKKETLT